MSAHEKETETTIRSSKQTNPPAGQKPRLYQPIWEAARDKADKGDSTPVTIEVKDLDGDLFRRIKKAFWKERDLDTEGRKLWSGKCWMEPDSPNRIYFAAVKKLTWKDRI
jgi:hypothetical protein